MFTIMYVCLFLISAQLPPDSSSLKGYVTEASEQFTVPGNSTDSYHISYHIISYHTTFAMAPINQSSAAPHITKTVVVYYIVSEL